MLKKYKHTINELPFIPKEATFTLDKSRYAYVDEKTQILFLWSVINFDKMKDGQWINTGKTLAEYNEYFVKEPHELDVEEAIKAELAKRSYKWQDIFLYKRTYMFRQWDDTVLISYNKPVKKGFKGAEKHIRYGAGETMDIRAKEYKLLDEFVQFNEVYIFENGKLVDE